MKQNNFLYKFPSSLYKLLIGSVMFLGVLFSVYSLYGNLTVFAQTPTLAVSMTPVSRTISPGQTTNYTVAVTRSGGFNSAVVLTVTACPASPVKCSFSSTDAGVSSIVIPAGSGSVSRTLYITSTDSLAVNNYNISVRGSGGSKVQNDTSTLVVNYPNAGFITRQYWDHLESGKGDVLSIFFNSDYPNSPTQTTQQTLFEAPTNIGNSYGTRILGYIYPPQTGNYTFWVASDDHSNLYLSSNENPFYKERIISVDAVTNSREWKSVNSATVQLQAGKKYFIEAVQDEFYNNDNLAVGWRLPDGTYDRPISGKYLALWDNLNQCPFQPETGRTIVQMQGTDHVALISDLEQYSRFSVPASLSAGNYKVSLASWDEANNQTQPQKQYYVRLLNNSDALVASTNATPLMTEANHSVIRVVNESLNVPSAVSKVEAVHSAYPTPTGQPNTVHAVCAAFDNVNVPMSGSLTPESTSCFIEAGSDSCNINFSWDTVNPVGTSAITKPTNITVATGNSGTSVPFAVKYNSETFYLYNNAQLLDQSTVTSSCVSGTEWSTTTNKCETVLDPASGTLVPDSSSCVIATGASTCNINFSWTTNNPVGTSAITKPTNITVATGNSGTSVPFAVKYNSETFYLYNNAQLLDQGTVLSTCSSGNSWDGSKCIVTPETCANGAVNPPLCTIDVNGVCLNGATNPPLCTTGIGGICANGAINPPLCTINGSGACLNGGVNPPLCTVNDSGMCINGTTNPPLCTINSGGTCLNGTVNPPLCTIDGSGTCINGSVNPPTCTLNAGGSCINAAIDPPTCSKFKKQPIFIED